jgi:hypothetical protein
MQSQVNSALGDKDTELPPGIVMPESWKHPTAAPTAGPFDKVSLKRKKGEAGILGGAFDE